jgi:hypothetical protein
LGEQISVMFGWKFALHKFLEDNLSDMVQAEMEMGQIGTSCADWLTCKTRKIGRSHRPEKWRFCSNQTRAQCCKHYLRQILTNFRRKRDDFLENQCCYQCCETAGFSWVYEMNLLNGSLSKNVFQMWGMALKNETRHKPGPLVGTLSTKDWLSSKVWLACIIFLCEKKNVYKFFWARLFRFLEIYGPKWDFRWKCSD